MTTPSTRRLARNFFDDALAFKIQGVACKLIPLTQGHFAVVELSDYIVLSSRTWSAMWQKANRSWYAVTNSPRSEGRHLVWMHREILDLPFNDPRQGDHIETGETLLNIRSNLRIASHLQQQHNKKKTRRNTSGFKGVCWKKDHNAYDVRIMVNRKQIRLGYRKDLNEAAELYRAGAKKYHGEFARFA